MDEHAGRQFEYDSDHSSGQQPDRRLYCRKLLDFLEANRFQYYRSAKYHVFGDSQETDKQLHGLHHRIRKHYHQTNTGERFVLPDGVWDQSRFSQFLLMPNPENERRNESETDAEQCNIGRLPNICDIRGNHTV